MTDITVLSQDSLLGEITRRLVDTFGPERIYLFGSKERGDAGPDSDYDLMVLIRDCNEPEYRLSQRAHALLWDLGVAADIIVWPVERFERLRHLRASLPATILREGVSLYAS
jgi:predicted nucleotidyltransferase